jgi:ABC-type Fe3+/spermidine/putrescine transport system ATPase subunit
LSNLDAKLRQQMRSEIRRICKEFGLTGLYVTHDRDEALSMADRLAVMDAGIIAQVGTPQEVYRNPANRMVAEFIGETNLIEAKVLQPMTEDGFYLVGTTLGHILARPNRADWQPVAGTRVLLSVRPEALTFAASAQSPNHFSGHIMDTHYLGTTAQYELETACGLNLKVCEMNPKTIRQPSVEEVKLMANPEDVVLLPQE